MSVNVCPGDIIEMVKYFVIKLGLMMQHHEPECHAKRLVCYLKGQGHSKGSYQNMMVSDIS